MGRAVLENGRVEQVPRYIRREAVELEILKEMRDKRRDLYVLRGSKSNLHVVAVTRRGYRCSCRHLGICPHIARVMMERGDLEKIG